MKELYAKLSSYKIFNYLFPGILYVVLLKEINGSELYPQKSILGFFLYYFIGLIISRLGALVVEPFLKKMNFIQFAPYKDYLAATDVDKKIELFLEIKDMYRTIIALLLLILLSIGYDKLIFNFGISATESTILIIVMLLFLFVFSYRKQTKMIVGRVSFRTKKNQ